MHSSQKDDDELQDKIANMNNGFEFESDLSEDHPISDIQHYLQILKRNVLSNDFTMNENGNKNQGAS